MLFLIVWNDDFILSFKKLLDNINQKNKINY